MAIGIDEVGRGCWAGPLLVVAARQVSEMPPGIRDSKLLSKKQRQQIYKKLIFCCRFGEGWVSSVEIDNHGVAAAMRLGVVRALQDLNASSTEDIIIDGRVNYVPTDYQNSRAMINADNLLPIVSAASIYAKVKRDSLMAELGTKYPTYFFERHVGYGTPQHRQAILTHGIIESVHRISFKPVAELL